MKKSTITISGMSCGHCAMVVTNALKNVDPGCKVEIDLTAKRVAITSTKDSRALAGALKRAGYAPA